MPQLFVFRHAKSSWTDTSIRDFDRPLANRGLKAAPRMGQYMRDKAISPDFILCSTSRRTRETLGLILPFLSGESRILLEDGIYEARCETEVLSRLRRLPPVAKRVMVIGHNPIMQDLTLELVKGAGDPERIASVRRKFPTAALATVDLGDTPWPALAAGCGSLRDFVIPKEEFA